MTSRFDRYKIILGIIGVLIPITGSVAAVLLGLQIKSIKADVKEEVLAEVKKNHPSKESQESLQRDVSEIKSDVKEMRKDFQTYIIEQSKRNGNLVKPLQSPVGDNS